MATTSLSPDFSAEFTTLDPFFSPKSVALIGASPKPGSLGLAILENIINGGYEGTLFLVNPKHSSINNHPCFPKVEDLPQIPDLGVICTPPSVVPSLIEELGQMGTKTAVVITAGFGEGENKEGVRTKDAMLEAARKYGVRIVGPNCLGIVNTSVKLNATFAPQGAKAGNVAFVSQSGALVVSLMEWASAMGIGFSKVLSVGELSDLNFADYVNYLKDDPQTEAIFLYIEAITDAQRFLRIAKETALKKPVIVMKSGRFQEAAKAVRSHWGPLREVMLSIMQPLGERV